MLSEQYIDSIVHGATIKGTLHFVVSQRHVTLNTKNKITSAFFYSVLWNFRNTTVLEDYLNSLSLSNNSSTLMKMSGEQWWNDTDMGNPKYSEGNLSHCHSDQQK